MAETAWDFYNDLQTLKMFPDMSAQDKEQATENILNGIQQQIPLSKEEALAELL